MKKEINNLAQYLNQPFSTAFSQATLENNLLELYPLVKTLNILVPATHAKRVKCKDCDLAHFETVIDIKGRYYTKCEYSEYGSLIEVKSNELVRYHFSVENFLKWIDCETFKQQKVERTSELVWFLGSRSNRNLYFIKSTDFEIVVKEADTINTQNNVFIWLGKKSRKGFSQLEHYAIQDLLTLTENELTIHLPKLKSKRAKPDENDIQLDRHIVITKDPKLLLEYENGTYNHEKTIGGKVFTIVQYLYNQKKYNKTYKSKELSNTLHIKPQNTIPTRIKELNNICDNYKVKRIIERYPNNTWALNPELTCFN
jgi:hypothetical protein